MGSKSASVTHRKEGPVWPGLTRIILYLLVVTAPLVLVAVVRPQTDHGLVYEVGKSLALLGFTILALQFVLAARLKWIEWPFGLDILFRFHRAMGVFGMALLLAHPLLLAAGGDGWPWLIELDSPWTIWLGRMTLLTLLIHGFLALFRLCLRLEFETWRFVHNRLALLALALGFLHSWNAGGDLRDPALQVLWGGMLAVAGVAYTYHRAVLPRWHGRHVYRVIEVQKETHDVWTIWFAPPKGEEPYEYLPGQFHFIRLDRGRSLPVGEHPFTISSSPRREGYVSSTIKESGDFTASIGQTRPGDRAIIHGPFGRFSYVLYPEERNLVFIAGGIGITPLMSMLRHMRDTRADLHVLLLYANKTESDIVFRDELSEIETGEFPRLQVTHILSQAEAGWTGETGHLNREKIQRLCGGNLAGKAFYVCGPPIMTEKIIQSLQDLGVAVGCIHVERFSL